MLLRASFGDIRIVQSLKVGLCSWGNNIGRLMETKTVTSCPRVKLRHRCSTDLMNLIDPTTGLSQRGNIDGSRDVGRWGNLRLFLGNKPLDNTSF